MLVKGMVLCISILFTHTQFTIFFLAVCGKRATVGWLYVTQLRTRSREKRSRPNFECFSREVTGQ